MTDILRAIVDDYAKWVGIFDETGLCVATTDGDLPPMSHTYWAEVPVGSLPNMVWYNPRTGQVEQCQDLDVQSTFSLQSSVSVGEVLTFKTPKNSVAFVNGIRQDQTFTIDTSAAKNIILELRGQRRGVFQFNIDDYATKRKTEYLAVASLPDQLDAIWKTATFPPGSEAELMQQKILAIKEKHPKPSQVGVSGVSKK